MHAPSGYVRIVSKSARKLRPNRSNDVVFDTSSLTKCLDEPGLLSRLIERLNSQRARMLVPLLAASELLFVDAHFGPHTVLDDLLSTMWSLVRSNRMNAKDRQAARLWSNST